MPVLSNAEGLTACLHIPRFLVEVERQRPARPGRPALATRLVLVGDDTVLDCSLGAETSGVRRGQRMSEAIGLCHRAVVLPPDPPHYRRRSEEVLDFLAGFSPEVEPAAETGTAYLSLRGLPVAPAPFAEELIAALHGRLGFMASAGVAGGKFAARAAALTRRPGLVQAVPEGGEAAFLAPLPVSFLPASDSMRWRLGLLGIETIGEVAALPLGAFQQQFGPEGKRCWELANGIDGEPLLPRAREETVVRRLQLPAPAVALETILAAAQRLLQAAYGDSGRRAQTGPRLGGRWVRKAVVRGTLDGPDGRAGGSWELPVPFREALADPKDAWFAVKSAIERHPPERPLEELEVELVGLSGESGKQASMFEGKGKLEGQVREAVRQLQAQHGRALVGKVVEVEPWSRIPERRSALVDLDP
jgi:DNA polymerase-4/protein ImuB